MASVDNYLRFVNEQIDFHKGRAEIYANSPKRQQKHLDTAKHLTELALFLEELQRQKESHPAEVSKAKITLTRSELEGLPKEVLDELSTSGTDTVGYAILDMMEQRGGLMSLDQIIVGLYREFGEIHKRQSVTSRMYRMAQRGLVKNYPGKKGVYVLADDGDAEDPQESLDID